MAHKVGCGIEALSALIDVPVGTLRQWRHRGEGPPGLRLGGHVRYRRSDVDKWLEELDRDQRRVTSA